MTYPTIGYILPLAPLSESFTKIISLQALEKVMREQGKGEEFDFLSC